METAVKQRVIETASSKPMSRRALAIAANVGYATITKMIEAGELDFHNNTVSAKKGKKSGFSLEVFDNQGRGSHSTYIDELLVGIRSSACTVGSRAAEKMGMTDNHKLLLSVNPADRSVYIGIAPEAATIKGYTARKDLNNVWRFPIGNAVGRVPQGLYKMIGEGRKYLGATWFKLNKVEE